MDGKEHTAADHIEEFDGAMKKAHEALNALLEAPHCGGNHNDEKRCIVMNAAEDFSEIREGTVKVLREVFLCLLICLILAGCRRKRPQVPQTRREQIIEVFSVIDKAIKETDPNIKKVQWVIYEE